jgi:hypothetical protein
LGDQSSYNYPRKPVGNTRPPCFQVAPTDSQQRINQLSTLYIVAVGFAKLSVLTLYLRFFAAMTTSRVLIWVGIVVTIASSFIFLGIEIFQATQCITLGNFATASFCTKIPIVVVGQAAVNVLLDFYILAIPLQQV